MKRRKTWTDFLAIALVLVCVLVGLGVLLYTVGVMIAMSNFGSNK